MPSSNFTLKGHLYIFKTFKQFALRNNALSKPAKTSFKLQNTELFIYL